MNMNMNMNKKKKLTKDQNITNPQPNTTKSTVSTWCNDLKERNLLIPSKI